MSSYRHCPWHGSAFIEINKEEEMSKKATSSQLKYFYFLTRKEELKTERETLVFTYSEGVTSDPKLLTVPQMGELIAHLVDEGKSNQQRKKIYSLFRQMGWEKSDRPDYERINSWMLKYSYLKKQLIKYSLEELPRLVSQVEKMTDSELATS